MGMSSTQGRLLQLTSRKNTIGRELCSLTLQKTSITRDSQRISREQQEALSAKVYKWTNNAGATYVDLSYATLMYPSTANANNPYLITDSCGKVVVDSKYRDYAEMISQNGSPGGDYSGSTRTKILEELTGISAEKIENADNAAAIKETSDDNVNDLQEEVDRLKSACTSKTQNDATFLSQCFGSIQGFNVDNSTQSSNIADDYRCLNKEWTLGSSYESSLDKLVNAIQDNASNHLFDDDLTKFKEACKNTKQTFMNLIEAGGIDNQKGNNVRYDGKNYYISVEGFINELLKQYTGTSYPENRSYEYTDRSSAEYEAYISKLAELEEAKRENSAIVDTNNMALSAADETQIAFYDKIFQAIADNGWTEDLAISDKNYLNQMLQNNMYYITTIGQDANKDNNTYTSSLASSFTHIVAVNDTQAQTEAAAKYEYEKSILNEKETRIDLRMKDLETEQSSINEMIKGLESVRDDNTERSFSVMS